MGHEPRRLYPATAETLARAVSTGHAIVAVRNEAEEAEVVVFSRCVVEGGVAASFEAEVFGSGESSTERVDPHDLRFMYGFWHVRPLVDLGPPDGGAAEE
jgi:predicted DNA-binding transcriptional regulator YafY